MLNQSKRTKIRDLKTKMANLELEIRSLVQSSEFEPGTIDAVYQDISNFTDEIRDISKQLLSIKSKKPQSNETSLVGIYESLIKENNPNIEEKIKGKTGNEWLELIKSIPIEELLEWANLSQHHNLHSLLSSISNKIKKI